MYLAAVCITGCDGDIYVIILDKSASSHVQCKKKHSRKMISDLVTRILLSHYGKKLIFTFSVISEQQS